MLFRVILRAICGDATQTFGEFAAQHSCIAPPCVSRAEKPSGAITFGVFERHDVMLSLLR